MTRAEIEAAERQQRREVADARQIARYQVALEIIVALERLGSVVNQGDAAVVAQAALLPEKEER